MNEFDFDITRACTSILANGVLHKYPDVRIIIPHSGGTMPVLAGRIPVSAPSSVAADTPIVNPERTRREVASKWASSSPFDVIFHNSAAICEGLEKRLGKGLGKLIKMREKN